MRRRTEYKTTTDNRIFNILHKEIHSDCSYDSWHPRYWGNFNNDNDRWELYGYFERDWKDYKGCTYKAGEGKHPSWKMVSKSRKQWMDKPIKHIRRWNYYLQAVDEWVYIEWKIRKKQKPR